jgi:hypothetical protein
MENKMCHPTLTDLNYILQRWKAKWSAQRDAAWQLRCAEMLAEDSSSERPRGEVQLPIGSQATGCNQLPAVAQPIGGIQLPTGPLDELYPVLDAKLYGFPLERSVEEQLFVRTGLSPRIVASFCKTDSIAGSS